MSNAYENFAEMKTIQGITTCAVLTDMHKADKVLEVACGSGTHSLMLASHFLKKGATLVSCDISTEMIKSFAEKFITGDNEYRYNPDNKALID